MSLLFQKLCFILLVCIQCFAPFVHAHAFGLDNHTPHLLHFQEAGISVNNNDANDFTNVKSTLESQVIDNEGAVINTATGLKLEENDDLITGAHLWVLILGFILLVFVALTVRFNAVTDFVLSQIPRFTLFHAQAPPKSY